MRAARRACSLQSTVYGFPRHEAAEKAFRIFLGFPVPAKKRPKNTRRNPVLSPVARDSEGAMVQVFCGAGAGDAESTL